MQGNHMAAGDKEPWGVKPQEKESHTEDGAESDGAQGRQQWPTARKGDLPWA